MNISFVFIVSIVILLVVMVIPKPECFVLNEVPKINATTRESAERVGDTVRVNDSIGFLATGESMIPAITPNQNCICTKTCDYKKNDIVVYYIEEPNPKFIVHRIAGHNLDGSFIMKGDNNIFIDPYEIYSDDIICEIEQKSMIERFINMIIK